MCNMHKCLDICIQHAHMHTRAGILHTHGVASVSRSDKIIDLFCKRDP